MNNIKPIICALYTRVSSQGQMGGDYNSLESQRERLEAYCKSQENHQIYKIYEDGAYSGENLDRPKFREMLQDIREGKINCVVTYKIDRLTRSVKDFHVLMDIFDKQNVKFVSVTQCIDTQTATGRLMRNIILDFAQFEREMTSDRTKDKMLQRAQKGLWNGGHAPFGYCRKDKHLVKNPEEASRVEFMFNKFADVPSVAQLREELHKRSWYQRSGQPWGKTVLHYVLRNPVYMGKVRFNGQLYKGEHEPIVEESLFQKVQSLRPDCSHVKTKLQRVFLLKGLLKCNDCGSFMTPHYSQKRLRNGQIQRIAYYRCTKTMHFNNRVCGIKHLNADQTENRIVQYLHDLSQNENYVNMSIEELNKNLQSKTEPLEKEALQIKKRINEIESEIDNYVKALGKGRISIERLEKEIERLETDKNRLLKQLDDINQKINGEVVKDYDATILKRNLNNFKASFGGLTRPEQVEALQCILKDVTAYPDKFLLEIFELAEFTPGSQKSPNWLLGQDSNLGHAR